MLQKPNSTRCPNKWGFLKMDLKKGRTSNLEQIDGEWGLNVLNGLTLVYMVLGTISFLICSLALSSKDRILNFSTLNYLSCVWASRACCRYPHLSMTLCVCHLWTFLNLTICFPGSLEAIFDQLLISWTKPELWNFLFHTACQTQGDVTLESHMYIILCKILVKISVSK